MIKAMFLMSMIATAACLASPPEKIRFKRDCASVLDDSINFRIDKTIFQVKCIRHDKKGLYVLEKDIIKTWNVQNIISVADSEGNVHHIPHGTIDGSGKEYTSRISFGSFD